MLTIRNRTASSATTSAAQTSRTGSIPDSVANMEAADLEFRRWLAGNGFITRYADRSGRKKGFGLPKPFF